MCIYILRIIHIKWHLDGTTYNVFVFWQSMINVIANVRHPFSTYVPVGHVASIVERLKRPGGLRGAIK